MKAAVYVFSLCNICQCVCLYLRQLLSDPDLTVRLVVDLEPGGLLPASAVPLWDGPLSSPPVEVHLRVDV